MSSCVAILWSIRECSKMLVRRGLDKYTSRGLRQSRNCTRKDLLKSYSWTYLGVLAFQLIETVETVD